MEKTADLGDWIFSRQGSRAFLILAFLFLSLFALGALAAGFCIVGPTLHVWKEMDAKLPLPLAVFDFFYSFLRAEPFPFLGGIAVIAACLLYKEEHLPSASAAKVNLAFAAAAVVLTFFLVCCVPLFLILGYAHIVS